MRWMADAGPAEDPETAVGYEGVDIDEHGVVVAAVAVSVSVIAMKLQVCLRVD